MFLNLNRIRTAQERYDKVYGPAAFGSGQDAFHVSGPVSLGFDIFKDKEHFRLVGGVRTTLELPCRRSQSHCLASGGETSR